MPDAPSYVSGEEFKAMLGLTGLAFEDAAADRAVLAASRAVEKLAGRRVFYPTPTVSIVADDDPGTPQARTFTAISRHRVRLDDLLEVSEVATRYGTEWAVWDESWYELDPSNAAAHGEPYQELVPLGRCLPELCRNAIRVTGRWGWEEAPTEVTQATMLLAHRLFERKKAPFGIATWGTVDLAVRIGRTDPDIAMLIDGVSRKSVLA